MPRALAFALASLVSLPVVGASTAPHPLRVTLSDRALQPGELVVVTIAAPRDATAVAVRALGRDAPAFRVRAGRWRALVGLDLDQTPGASTLEVEARGPSGAVASRWPFVVRPKRFPTRRLAVDPDFVNPPASVRDRIEQESAFLADAYAHSAAEALWRPPFVRPVPGASTSRFGTRSVFNGEPRNPHGGADLVARSGTPVKAPNAGRVVVARPLYLSGNSVVIDHGLGLFSLLAHLSRIDVREGDVVRSGQVVGLSGATGRVTGPHLHWSLRVGGARVDPMAALALLR